MPLSDAGPRMEPPVSEPSPPAHRAAATAAPVPLLDPPGVCSRFHGLRGVAPRLAGAPMANSLMVCFPSSTDPASLSFAMTVASSSGTRSAKTFDPPVVSTPLVSYRSLWAMGMPWSGPLDWPPVMAFSASRASARADSARTVM